MRNLRSARQKGSQYQATATLEAYEKLHDYTYPKLPLEQMLATSFRLNVSAQKILPYCQLKSWDIDLCSEPQLLVARWAAEIIFTNNIAVVSPRQATKLKMPKLNVAYGLYLLRDLMKKFNCQAGLVALFVGITCLHLALLGKV